MSFISCVCILSGCHGSHFYVLLPQGMAVCACNMQSSSVWYSQLIICDVLRGWVGGWWHSPTVCMLHYISQSPVVSLGPCDWALVNKMLRKVREATSRPGP